MLRKFNMAECKLVSIPMETGCKLIKNDDSPSINQTLYRSMIGIFLYLTTSRPNIMQEISMVSRFQYDTMQYYHNAMHRILKYIQGTLDYGLWYPHKNDFTLSSYTNADWGGSDDKKSTNGASFFLGECLVSWDCKKQDCVTLSTCESKYFTATTCCYQLIWMNYQLSDLGI